MIPLGFCQCGCGRKTSISKQNHARHGHRMGIPMLFAKGHNGTMLKLPPFPTTIDGKECFGIPLSKGYVAYVSPEDVERVCQLKWTTHFSGSGGAYAVTSKRSHGVAKYTYLHHFVMDVGVELDHIDRNGLNCCRWNLRVCTRVQNVGNTKRRKHNKSGLKGVYWSKAAGKWAAQCRRRHLGVFDELEAAGKAYDQAAREYFGEFAYCNFPPDEPQVIQKQRDEEE